VPDPDNRLLVDYYHGPYGPTLLIPLSSLDQGLKLRSVFVSLSEETKLELKASDIEWVRLQGLKDLILRVTTERNQDIKSLRKITRDFAGVVFKWSQSKKGWARSVGLLDGLLKHGGPGHQYFTTEGVDDALVEVSLMEELSTA